MRRLEQIADSLRSGDVQGCSGHSRSYKVDQHAKDHRSVLSFTTDYPRERKNGTRVFTFETKWRMNSADHMGRCEADNGHNFWKIV